MMLFTPSARGGLSINKPAELSRVIATARGTPGEHMVPVVQADLAGEIRLLLVVPGGRVPTKLLDRRDPPTLLILGGDPGSARITPGPSAFPQVRRLLGWAGATMLHAAEGKVEHYSAAIDATRLVRRVVLIETAPDQQDAWYSLVLAETQRRERSGQQLPTLVISPRPPAFAEASA
jgi:hypothetical protein